MRRRQAKSKLLGFGLVLAMPAAALGQEAPQFMRETLPEQAVDPAWQEFQSISDPEGALGGMTKELIGIAVAAGIPCEYCVYYHTKAAQQHGATDEQIKEALASAALTRKWSTMLNGSQYDEQEWRRPGHFGILTTDGVTPQSELRLVEGPAGDEVH